jgi:hypothetical protein
MAMMNALAFLETQISEDIDGLPTPTFIPFRYSDSSV